MNKLYVVGIGPGEFEQMTRKAVKVLRDCEIIVGYTVYIDLIKEHFSDKTYLTTPMRQEKERCILAFEEVKAGRTTAMVCSGDPGVYGMSGLILEVGIAYPEVQVEMIPGVTAALSGAAVLGAPLMHDFVVISLSDLLTPWDTIKKRLEMAAQGDFVICLYNPSSKKRKDYLRKACEYIMEYAKADTICGIVQNIGRDGESMEIMTLSELAEKSVDMFTTVYIGNSMSKNIGNSMVTPRGYKGV